MCNSVYCHYGNNTDGITGGPIARGDSENGPALGPGRETGGPVAHEDESARVHSGTNSCFSRARCVRTALVLMSTCGEVSTFLRESESFMRTLVGVCLLLGGLTGCGAEGIANFKQAQADWNSYVNSPAYHQTTTSSTFRSPYGTIWCTTTADNRTGDSVTQCN